MTALRKEMLDYMNTFTDEDLDALRPLFLRLLKGKQHDDNKESIVIDTDLDEDERALYEERMAEYERNPQDVVPLSEVLRSKGY